MYLRCVQEILVLWSVLLEIGFGIDRLQRCVPHRRWIYVVHVFPGDRFLHLAEILQVRFVLGVVQFSKNRHLKIHVINCTRTKLTANDSHLFGCNSNGGSTNEIENYVRFGGGRDRTPVHEVVVRKGLHHETERIRLHPYRGVCFPDLFSRVQQLLYLSVCMALQLCLEDRQNKPRHNRQSITL